MNPRGSYRKLLANAKSAMLAAVEIYNKPRIDYRDECFCILLINAWELLAKAILSKNQQRIFYKKKRHEWGSTPRTYSLRDALKNAKPHFPDSVSYEPVVENINRLVEYRDNSIHFYNDDGFPIVVYALAQTSIVNFNDILRALFAADISSDMTFALMPIGFGTAPNPIDYIRDQNADLPRNREAAKYLKKITDVTKYLESKQLDTKRFLTQFDVRLQSVKRISSADIVVGIDGEAEGNRANVVIERRYDPNDSHPLKRTDIFEKIGPKLNGADFNNYVLNAIVYTRNCKEDKTLIWQAKGGGAMQYSEKFVNFLRELSEAEVLEAVEKYKKRNRRKAT